MASCFVSGALADCAIRVSSRSSRSASSAVIVDIRTRTVSAEQQVMAMQAEAIREKRARIIKAEAELEASEKLAAAPECVAGNPAALELRRMQRIAEVGAENNSTTVPMIPSDFVSLSKSLSDYLRERTKEKT